MPRKKSTAKSAATENEEELEGTLFDDGDDRIDHVAVERVEPDEGFLGKMDHTCSEEDIRAKYGGGKFRLRARDGKSRFIKGVPVVNVTIGGDPLFQSATFEAQWKRRQGISSTPSNTNGAVSDKPLGFGELMLLMSRASDAARQEAREAAELRAREADKAHERQLSMMREESARREKELAHERERMKTEALEREARLTRETQAERERQREHSSAMLQLVTEKAKQSGEGGGAVQTLIAGMKLAQEMGGGAGGGESDPLTAFAQNLPDIIEQGGRLMAMDKATSASAGKIRANPPKRLQHGKDDVVLQGVVAKKAAQVVEHLTRMGKDPARVLAQTFDVLSRTSSAPPPPTKRPSSSSRPTTTRTAAPPSRAAARKPAPRRAPTSGAPKSPAPSKTATPKR